MRAVGRMSGWAVRGSVAAVVCLTAYPPHRLTAQDTSTIDRGVRIGIIYRPGVRPGFVLLPRRGGGAGGGLDLVRALIARDLDYSDRFEVITLPGGDSIRLAMPGAAAGAATRRLPAASRAGPVAGGGTQ